jgi:hypothetical protein
VPAASPVENLFSCQHNWLLILPILFTSLNVCFWPKADPENLSFAVVKASALEKSGH